MKKLVGILLTSLLIIGLFPQSAMAALSPTFEADILSYLNEISAVRGFEITREDFDATLATYGFDLEDFESVEELKTYLGEVIKADLSNLKEIYKIYDLNEETLQQLLAENGEELNDYIYLDDLDFSVYFYKEFGSMEEDPNFNLEIFDELLPMLLEQFKLTDEEYKRIEEYLEPYMEYFESSEFEDKMMEISDRLLALSDVLLSEELTDEQISELTSIIEDLYSALKIKLVFIHVKDGVETELSILEMLQLEDISDSSFIIKVYGVDSQFLADVEISNEFIKQICDLLGITTESVTDNDKKPVVNNPKKEKDKTIKGAKLPKTASPYLQNAIFGLAIVSVGLLLHKRVRDTKSEENNQKSA